MLESMQQDYVRVARAKGLKESTIVRRHVLPNALIPVVTLGGLALCPIADRRGPDRNDFLLARSWPLHLPQRGGARFSGDHGITLVVAVTYLIINLIIDISYALLDPRVVR